MDEGRISQGGCMCGEVRYEAVGEPRAVGHCHCNSCRRHSGAPVTTYAAFERERVAFTKGDRRIYNSSPGVDRAFCGNCGTTLTYEGKEEEWDGLPFILLHIGTLDNPSDFVPDRHWYPEERIAWFEIKVLNIGYDILAGTIKASTAKAP